MENLLENQRNDITRKSTDESQVLLQFSTYNVYFIVSSGIMAHHLHEHFIETRDLLSAVHQWKLEYKGNQNIFSYKTSFRKRSRIEDFLSGCNTFDNILSEDKNSWENVAFARYYGIKGIRMFNDKTTIKND